MTTLIATLAVWIATRARSERGASLVEYALLVALIAVVCVAAVTVLGSETSGQFSEMGASLANTGS